ncbi:hypothetical protein H4R18_001625 [Coemansia javaensis]|uniref:RING-type domain-containing protein n=1 Tax=Coemansia javaensis TaxID=2761396 RepID=A0A9W8HGM7_9FUNG|nr:hypothetical protein H4R18_001625 [Coemansia javaensis]
MSGEGPLRLPQWLHCNKCGAFVPGGSSSSSGGVGSRGSTPGRGAADGAGRQLHILECTHIVCGACLGPSSGNAVCAVCGAACASRCIGADQLPADVQAFLDDALVLSELDRLRYCIQFQINNQAEAIQTLRSRVAKQNGLLREARAYIERLQQQQQQQHRNQQQAGARRAPGIVPFGSPGPCPPPQQQ